MTDTHDTTAAEEVPDRTATRYRALDALLHLAPTRRINGRYHKPYWRPKAATLGAGGAFIPAGDWAADVKAGTRLVDLDVNAAYLAAMGSTKFSHSELVRTGRQPWPMGYFLIDHHTWPDSRIMSPLGTLDVGPVSRIWVTHPTLALLDSLASKGLWPELEVHDSWTAEHSCDFRKWFQWIKQDRTEALAGMEGARRESWERRYDAIKTGYSVAVQMMRGPGIGDCSEDCPADCVELHPGKRKSPIVRPDWYDTIHAQHRASMWRKAWSALQAGHPPVYIGAVDELTFTADSWTALQQLTPMPFRYDGSGMSPGAVKVKATRIAGEDA